MDMSLDSWDVVNGDKNYFITFDTECNIVDGSKEMLKERRPYTEEYKYSETENKLVKTVILPTYEPMSCYGGIYVETKNVGYYLRNIAQHIKTDKSKLSKIIIKQKINFGSGVIIGSNVLDYPRNYTSINASNNSFNFYTIQSFLSVLDIIIDKSTFKFTDLNGKEIDKIQIIEMGNYEIEKYQRCSKFVPLHMKFLLPLEKIKEGTYMIEYVAFIF